jgi:hypothetical protein
LVWIATLQRAPPSIGMQRLSVALVIAGMN